jgi:small conductance mechanosensitive channel
LADTVRWVIDVPVRIAVFLVAAVLLDQLVRRLVHRELERLNERSVQLACEDSAKPVRSTRRMASASSTLASGAAVATYNTALVPLGEFGISLSPLLAGVVVVGLAIGFGAQHLVRDVRAALFVIIEDQHGVGDIIVPADNRRGRGLLAAHDDDPRHQ